MTSTKVLQLKFICIALATVLFVVVALSVCINVAFNVYLTTKQTDMLDYIISNNGNIITTQTDDEGTVLQSAPYNTGYFYLMTDQSGRIMTVSVSNISTITQEQALEYGEKIKATDTSGNIDNFEYKVGEKSYGKIYVFLDCAAEVSSQRSLIVMSIVISAVSIVIIGVLLFFFSFLAVKPLNESIERQKRFITDATHEIKTPLAIISANASVLSLENGDSEWTDSIQKQTSRLSHLVNQLITLSKFSESSFKNENAVFNISEDVYDVATGFNSLAEKNKQDYKFDIEEGLDYYGDELQLRQLVSILLDNAVKYADGKIRVSLKRVRDHIELTVYNNCAEMTETQLKHLFDRFYRADDSRSRSTGGNGIGLSVAKAVVEAHNGKIIAESKDGKSLTIIIKLPIASSKITEKNIKK